MNQVVKPSITDAIPQDNKTNDLIRSNEDATKMHREGYRLYLQKELEDAKRTKDRKKEAKLTAEIFTFTKGGKLV